MDFLKIYKKYPTASFQIILVLLFTSLILLCGQLNLNLFHEVFKQINSFVFRYFGGFYLTFALFCCFIVFGILLSPLGNIRLGGTNANKEHGTLSWLTMIFCTGMGVGFMFWGAAEPLYHFMNPPYKGIETNQESFDLAFSYTFLHWGFETWALYAMFVLCFGYWLMNVKKSVSFSSFINVQNPRFKFLELIPDAFTVIAVVFGIATTIGLGMLQVAGGLERIFNFEGGVSTKLFAVLMITFLYLGSIQLGLEKGLKVLSNLSVIISLILLFLIFFLTNPLETISNL
ncbi:MAG TPA: BCCT family transporter, partial [Vampirovibrionales bacterium]